MRRTGSLRFGCDPLLSSVVGIDIFFCTDLMAFFLEDVVGVEDIGVDFVVDVALFLEEDGVVPNDVDDFTRPNFLKL